jgi:hypothetical protein
VDSVGGRREGETGHMRAETTRRVSSPGSSAASTLRQERAGQPET